ncbi:hypothetical protein AVEN_46218-1, partial [Araneus ventricosus]
MTDSSHVWTPDLGDKFGDFGDEIWDLKGAGIFSIFLLGENIRHESARSFIIVTACRGNYIRRALGRRWVLIDWDRLGARTSLEFYRQCELGS